jgi:GrpB-like predicted nucleotidyltransferase (UPF0157 family)
MVPSIPVHLSHYDPAWPDIAAAHMARLGILGPLLVETHHIGSTSVPGLAAKPVVDLIGLVSDIDELERRQSELEAIGYVAYGEFGVPGRRFFTWDDPEANTRVINLHCYQVGAETARHQLAFRDYLRAHPEVAEDYFHEKQRAMKLFPDNSTLYAQEKGAFIRAVLDKALAWVGDAKTA